MKSDTSAELHRLILQERKGTLTRRQLLQRAGAAGFGALFGSSLARPTPLFAQSQTDDWRPAQAGLDWARDVSKPLRGTKIKLATENTPPSMALKMHLAKYFTEATGIEVEIDITPLEQVLEKLILGAAMQASDIDIFYVDQGWAAFAADEMLDPRETMLEMPDLNMPAYNLNDFIPDLVTGISSYKDRWIGVPYDVPIFITQYRRDIYQEFGFSAPTDLEEYYQQSKAITDTYGPELYGTTGQMKAGHLALEVDWTAWLWGHGGSIFDANGKFAGNDAAGLEAMEYWTRLWKTMPPEVLEWTWDGQGRSVAQGRAASMISWAEAFPHINTSPDSQVRGLIDVAICPRPKALRSPSETSFGEIPGIGHQGGSSLAVSRYSENQRAAWIFMQWATSLDTQTLISLFSGGTAPTRSSVFEDPRLAPYLDPETGTMRHLRVIQETIKNDMGSEPDLAQWTELASFTIPNHLGKYFYGQYDTAQAMMDDLSIAVDSVLENTAGQ